MSLNYYIMKYNKKCGEIISYFLPLKVCHFRDASRNEEDQKYNEVIIM